MARKWLYRFPPPIEPPVGHRHRLRRNGDFGVGSGPTRGLLPLLECSCGLRLVPNGRPKSGGWALMHEPLPPLTAPDATFADTGFIDEAAPVRFALDWRPRTGRTDGFHALTEEEARLRARQRAAEAHRAIRARDLIRTRGPPRCLADREGDDGLR